MPLWIYCNVLLLFCLFALPSVWEALRNTFADLKAHEPGYVQEVLTKYPRSYHAMDDVREALGSFGKLWGGLGTHGDL